MDDVAITAVRRPSLRVLVEGNSGFLLGLFLDVISVGVAVAVFVICLGLNEVAHFESSHICREVLKQVFVLAERSVGDGEHAATLVALNSVAAKPASAVEADLQLVDGPDVPKRRVRANQLSKFAFAFHATEG